MCLAAKELLLLVGFESVPPFTVKSYLQNVQSQKSRSGPVGKVGHSNIGERNHAQGFMLAFGNFLKVCVVTTPFNLTEHRSARGTLNNI